MLMLLAGLIVVFLLSLFVGSVRIPLDEILGILVGRYARKSDLDHHRAKVSATEGGNGRIWPDLH